MKRKVISLILALTLCSALAIPALAENQTVIVQNGISISNVSEVKTEPVTAFEKWINLEGNLKWISTYLLDFETVQVYYSDAPSTISVTATAYAEIVNWYYDNTETSNSSIVNNLQKNEDGYFVGELTFTEPGTYLINDGYTAMFGSFFLIVGTATPTSPIAEVPSSWAAEQVNAAITANLVPDALQSKYTQATTRAEFCALAVALYETATGSEITERAQFSDTTDVNVEKMAALSVVNGIGDNKFDPNAKLTREQAATMLSRLANAIGKPLTEQAATFGDNGSVSSWAADAVGQMQATGIMGGVGNNTFAPKSDYTREQSIITMMRLFDIVK